MIQMGLSRDLLVSSTSPGVEILGGHSVYSRLVAVSLLSLLLFTMSSAPVFGAPDALPDSAWTGSDEQKLWGLMTVSSEVKYTFPHFENRPELDWDREVRILDGRFFVDRVGSDPALAEAGVVPGVAIVEIEAVPAARYFAENVLRYHSQNTRHGTEAFFVVYLLFGPSDEPVTLSFQAADGTAREAAVPRNALSGDAPFMTRLMHNALSARTIRARSLPGGIQYVEIPNFEHESVSADFLALIDGFGDVEPGGMIIDVRYNAGGASSVVKSTVEARDVAHDEVPSLHRGVRGVEQRGGLGDFRILNQPAGGTKILGSRRRVDGRTDRELVRGSRDRAPRRRARDSGRPTERRLRGTRARVTVSGRWDAQGLDFHGTPAKR